MAGIFMNKLLSECLKIISNGSTPSITKLFSEPSVHDSVYSTYKAGRRICNNSDCQARVDVKQIQIELSSRCPKF